MTDHNLITVTDLANYAPEVDTSRYTSATISGMISQASKIASDYLLYTPIAEDIVNEVTQGRVSTEGDLIVFPVKIPIQSVASITLLKGTTTLGLNLTDGSGNNRYNTDWQQRNIRYPYSAISTSGGTILTDFIGLRGRQFYVRLSYRAGFEPSALPYSITQAVILIMRDLLSKRYNQMGANKVQQGGISFEFSQTEETESQMLKEAKKLLNPYRRI